MKPLTPTAHPVPARKTKLTAKVYILSSYYMTLYLAPNKAMTRKSTL
jgi:hypothetical protein